MLVSGCVSAPTVSPTASAQPSTTATASPTIGLPLPTPSTTAPPSAGAPAEALAVTVETFAFSRGDRPLPTTVWYPSTAGRYPVVVFGHGLGGAPLAYFQLLRRWAAAGFVVAAPAFPHTSFGAPDFTVVDVLNQPADLSAVLDGLIALPGDGRVRQRLDITRVAVAGHSAGAITALGCFTADGPQRRDPRFGAAVILAGNTFGMGDAFTGAPAAILFVHAADDPVVPTFTGRLAYAAVPWPKAFLTLPSREHTDPYLNPSDPQFDTVVAATTDFLRWRLYGDTAAAGRLAATSGLENHLAG